ncbi:MAG: triphosphoribosyl-dephospho-CoA synthase [Methylococcales bacterium]|nr:triphosphoribosyl-dephospho-CoA synthase [Methylococcales bacterium]
MISPLTLSALYQQACEVELQAFKPGNVSIYADGHDMTVADFRVSAKVSAAPLCNPNYSLGEKIFYAVKATREAVACNTNLGIILLCAPLIQAAARSHQELPLRQALQQILTSTTVADADWVFKAITLASPGGLGSAESQDVAENPSVNLTEAMRLASARDRIAHQFVTDYQDIFDFSLLIYYNAMSKWGNQEWAAVSVYTHFFSRFPDSHIERKYGDRYTTEVAEKMSQLSDALAKADNPEYLLPLFFSADKLLKGMGVNPGTMADLTVATVFTVFLEDVIKNLHNKNLPT